MNRLIFEFLIIFELFVCLLVDNQVIYQKVLTINRYPWLLVTGDIYAKVQVIVPYR